MSFHSQCPSQNPIIRRCLKYLLLYCLLWSLVALCLVYYYIKLNFWNFLVNIIWYIIKPGRNFLMTWGYCGMWVSLYFFTRVKKWLDYHNQWLEVFLLMDACLNWNFKCRPILCQVDKELTPSTPQPSISTFTELLYGFMGYVYMHVNSLVNLFPLPPHTPNTWFPLSSEICQFISCFHIFESICLSVCLITGFQ